MIAKKFRLPIQSFFGDKAPRYSRVVKSPYFTAKIFPSKLAYSRFGAVVSKKLDNRASKRNSIRRAVLDFFGEKTRKFPLGDYLVLVSPSASKLDRVGVMAELSRLAF